MSFRPVPAEKDDILFTVTSSYHHRPDLLAHDLYKDSKLWWVFAQRNPNVIEDPIYDFKAGTTIRIPKKDTLSQNLK